ncbi:dynein regulatory complex subunit 4 [Halyomorpha halys]|uniref:dynein regulatory complex subunit 4 n=1 Tax=Halyomorpha halys TaxID=286706 RepID=UPI0006D52576|nr:growth arrest-specific protein 8-like [Halyomorpha halys]
MAKAPVEIIVDGKNINDMQWAPLQKHIVEMTHSLILERGERTKARKECDVIRTFWENTEKELEEAKAEVVKKYLQVSVLWDQYKEPYKEIHQEMTFQKFMLNFEAQYNEKECRKRADLVSTKWEKEVLPKMMEIKTKEALRFDKKQDELNKEYKEAQKDYEKIIENAVKRTEDKMLDWEVVLYQRTLVRKRYHDLQFLLKKFFCCEQKNLLIHELKDGHKVNFEKIRAFIRERIEGDLLQIVSLSQNIEKLSNEKQSTSKDIEHYKMLLKEKQDQLKDLDKTVKLCELRINSYKQNMDLAIRSEKKMEKLNKDKIGYDERRSELEKEIKRRQEEKRLYLTLLENLREDVKKLQNQYFGDIFDDVLKRHMVNLKEFDTLFEEYQKKSPNLARQAKKKFFFEKGFLEQFPLLVTREIKGHNDFIESAMEKLKQIGIQHSPQFVHITSESFPTGSGPAGLTCF